MDKILKEAAVKLPVSFNLRKAAGGRYQLVIVMDEIPNEGQCLYGTYLNFYDGEQLYMHVENGVLTYIVSKEQQEPSFIKKRLKDLVSIFKFAWKMPE